MKKAQRAEKQPKEPPQTGTGGNPKPLSRKQQKAVTLARSAAVSMTQPEVAETGVRADASTSDLRSRADRRICKMPVLDLLNVVRLNGRVCTFSPAKLRELAERGSMKNVKVLTRIAEAAKRKRKAADGKGTGSAGVSVSDASKDTNAMQEMLSLLRSMQSRIDTLELAARRDQGTPSSSDPVVAQTNASGPLVGPPEVETPVVQAPEAPQ